MALNFHSLGFIRKSNHNATDFKAFHGQIYIPIYKNYGQWASTISQQKQERHFDRYADLGLVNLLLSSCLLGLMVCLIAANVIVYKLNSIEI